MLIEGQIAAEFGSIAEYFSPRVIARVNDQYVKLAKLKGDFVWHNHAEEDEMFIVFKGTLAIDYRDGRRVVLNPGDFHVVPRGVDHLPVAEEEVHIMLIEPAATKHAGDTQTDLARSVAEQTAHLS